MTVGERIRQKRIELELSQDELAKRVGYKSRSSIQKIECARDLPLNKVELMANALGCSPSYLMGWTDRDGNDTVMGQLVKSYEERIFPKPQMYEPEIVEQAMFLYELYRKAPPEIQAAVETLLKATKSDS